MNTANKSRTWGNAIMSGLVAGVVMGLSVLYGGNPGYFAWLLCWVLLFSWLRPFSERIVAILICVVVGVLISNVPGMLSTESANQIKTEATLEDNNGTMSIKVILGGDLRGHDYIVRLTKSAEYTDWYEQKSVTSENLADGSEIVWFPVSIPGNPGESEPPSVNDMQVEVIEPITGLPIYSELLYPSPEEVQVVPMTSAQSNDVELDGVWPTTSHDMQRSGRSPYIGPEQPFLAWKVQKSVYGKPFIGKDGTLYLADYYLFAVSPNGNLMWAFKQNAHEIAIGGDGTIYFGSQDNGPCVFAVSPQGVFKWKFLTDGDGFRFAPAIGSDGTIYVATADFSVQQTYVSQLYAIDPNGSLKWKLNIEGQIDSSPAIGANDTIFFTCLNTASGNAASPLSGELYAINSDGTSKWTCSLNNRGNLAIAENGVIYVKSWGILFAVNPDGSIKWENRNYDTGFGSLAVNVDGTAYVGADDGKLYAISADGQTKWSFTTGLSSAPLPAIDYNGTIYFGGSGNNICALNPDGTLKWKFAAGGSPPSMAIGADGCIYTGSGQAICSKP